MGLSLKLAVLSATIVSTAIMFKLSSPFITNLSISDIPFIWATLISWLRPPYLYVVLNCIIITIVASSRLQSKLDSDYSLSSFPASTEPVKVALPVEAPTIHQPEVRFPQPVDISVDAGYNSELNTNSNSNSNSSSKYVEVLEPEFSTPEFSDASMNEEMKIAKEAYEKIKKNKVNKSVISMSAWTPSEINQVGLSFPTEKPPASARFSHRKPAKAAPEGSRTLGVAKPKRQDTLETTWKAITEGRSVPLTRHLRKSDTWETHGHRRETRSSDDFPTDTNRMTKSDTFNGTTTTNTRKTMKPPPAPSKLSRSGGSGRLKKEPSLGQEELNRRVEAFIKKFNEDMRLQRQESLNQYMEMINRGAY